MRKLSTQMTKLEHKMTQGLGVGKSFKQLLEDNKPTQTRRKNIIE